MKGFICFVSIDSKNCGQLQSFMFIEAHNVLEAKLWSVSHLAQLNRDGGIRKLLWVEEARR